MSKEKQIDERITVIEIKKILCGKPCDICNMNNERCAPYRMAIKLAAKDYRKQSEGEWIEKPHFNFEGGYSGANYECSNCHFDDIYDLDNMNYCPNCGAKMKGGK